MNRAGSQLVQAIMLMAVFSAAMTAFMGMRNLSPARDTVIVNRATKKLQIVNAAVQLSCDRYLFGLTLKRKTATEVATIRADFASEGEFVATASVPAYAPPFAADTAIPILIHVTHGKNKMTSKVDVYGVPGFDAASGNETLSVTECVTGPFEQECRHGIEEARQSGQYFDAAQPSSPDDLSGLVAVSRCLERSYKSYGPQHCIEPYMTVAMVLNYCKQMHENIQSILDPNAKSTINAFCAFRLNQVLARSPAGSGVDGNWPAQAIGCISGLGDCKDLCVDK